MWLIIVIFCFYVTISLGIQNVQRYFDNPTVIYVSPDVETLTYIGTSQVFCPNLSLTYINDTKQYYKSPYWNLTTNQLKLIQFLTMSFRELIDRKKELEKIDEELPYQPTQYHNLLTRVSTIYIKYVYR